MCFYAPEVCLLGSPMPHSQKQICAPSTSYHPESLCPSSHWWNTWKRWWWLCVNMAEPNSFLGIEQILLHRKPEMSSSTDLHWVSMWWFWSSWKRNAKYQYPLWLCPWDTENFLTIEEVWELGKCNFFPFLIKRNRGHLLWRFLKFRCIHKELCSWIAPAAGCKFFRW